MEFKSWKTVLSRCSSTPLLDLKAFKYNMFSLTTVIGIAVTVVMYADMMLLPIYLQNARGFTALETGFAAAPLRAYDGDVHACHREAI